MDPISRRAFVGTTGAVTLSAGLIGCRESADQPVDTDKRPREDQSSSRSILVQSAEAGRGESLVEKDSSGVYLDELGRSYDSAFDESLAPYARGTVRREDVVGPDDATGRDIDYQTTESQSTYYAAKSFSASAKGGFGPIKAKGSISSSTVETANSYNFHLITTCRRHDRPFVLDNADTAPIDQARAIVSRNWNSDRYLMRMFGDKFVNRIVPIDLLFVDIVVQTHSESQKKSLAASLKASFAGIAKGKGSYSELIESASSAKNVSAKVIGFKGNIKSTDLSATEVDRVINEFFDSKDAGARTARIDLRDIRELKVNGHIPDWIDFSELSQRRRFVQDANARWIELDQREIDALYVSANKEEFDQSTYDRARSDLTKIRQSKLAVEKVAQDAYDHFKNDGRVDDRFAISALEKSRNFAPYLRLS